MSCGVLLYCQSEPLLTLQLQKDWLSVCVRVCGGGKIKDTGCGETKVSAGGSVECTGH